MLAVMRVLSSILLLTFISCGDESAQSLPDQGLPVDASTADASQTDLPQEALPPGPFVLFLEPGVPTFLFNCATPQPARLRVSSQLEVKSLTLNGLPLPNQTGDVEATFVPVPGLNLLTAEVRDVAGRKGRGHRAVLCGQWGQTMVPDAVDLWLGKAAISSIGRLAAAVFDQTDLNAAFVSMGPLYESDAIRVDPLSVAHARGTAISLEPAWDRLVLDTTVYGFEAFVRAETAEGAVFDIGVVSAQVSLHADLLISLGPDGTLVADVETMQVDLGDVQLIVRGIGDVLDAFPYLRDRIVSAVGDELASLVKKQVPPLVQSAFARLSEPVPVSLLGKAFVLKFSPSGLKVKPAGMEVALDVSVLGLEPDPAYSSPGLLVTPEEPELPRPDGLRVAIRDELLNGVFGEVWRSGLLSLTVDQAFLDQYKVEVTLVAGFLCGLLPATVDPETPVSLKVQARLPPVADVDLPVSGGIRLGFGEVAIDVATADGTPLMSIAATARLDGEVQPSGPDRVQLLFNALSIVVDASDPALMPQGPDGTVTELLDSLGPLLGGMLQAIPLPSLLGFHVANLSVGTLRGGGGTIVMTGDLVEAP